MSTFDDVKFIAKIEYDIYNNDNNYSREKLIDMIIDIFDTINLIKNLKKKEKELLFLIDDDDE